MSVMNFLCSFQPQKMSRPCGRAAREKVSCEQKNMVSVTAHGMKLSKICLNRRGLCLFFFFFFFVEYNCFPMLCLLRLYNSVNQQYVHISPTFSSLHSTPTPFTSRSSQSIELWAPVRRVILILRLLWRNTYRP